MTKPVRNKMSLSVVPKGAPFSWRYPGAHAESDLNFNHYRQLAETAERGKLDMLFFADSVSILEDRIGLDGVKGFGTMIYFDSVMLIGALAAITKHIGLAATCSTTYNEPYNLARRFATIDGISNGRAGWNVVTSGHDSEAFNFGLDQQLSTEERYERAAECLEVVFDLWDSWEDDAVVRDRAKHTYFDPAKVHHLNHAGKHFKVRGPLNISRPPQGHPIICQAGGSDAGWELAARTADVLFGKAITLQEGQRFTREVKGRMARYGRTPDELKILFGLVPVVGRTKKEAQEKFRAVLDCLTEEEGRDLLAHYMPGADLSKIAINDKMPDTPEINEAAKRFRLFLEENGRQRTLREMIDSAATGIGTLSLIGSAGEVADTMAEWFREGAGDGFNFSPQYHPGGVDDFVNLLVPELQERGVFRTEYEGATLRENLGLARPANRFAQRRRQTGA